MTDKRKIEECNDSEKPVDWKDFKRQKKELTLKRKQKNKLYDVNTESKKIYEQFKPKVIKGGNEKRAKLIAELHSKLKNNGKFTITHHFCIFFLQKVKNIFSVTLI